MNTTNDKKSDIQHPENYMREEMMLRHYFLNQQHALSDVEKAKALEEFHCKRRKKTRSTITYSLISGAAAILLLALLLRDNYLPLPPTEQTPVTVFLAKNDSENVTLQRDSGERLIVSPELDDSQLDKLGVKLLKAEDKLVYTAEIKSEKPQMQTLTTPRKKTFTVVLSDGTQVWLNTESQLIYPDKFGEEKRRVYLKGEAFFKVAKNENSPFIVETEDITTTVLGTEFNIRNYDHNNPHITLVQGVVEVSNATGEHTVKLSPGDNACLSEDGFRICQVDTYIYSAWKDGVFYFDNTPLVEIAQEIGRWYNIDVIFNNRKAMDVTMHFMADHHDSFDQIIERLNSLKKAKITFKKNQLIID